MDDKTNQEYDALLGMAENEVAQALLVFDWRVVRMVGHAAAGLVDAYENVDGHDERVRGMMVAAAMAGLRDVLDNVSCRKLT